MQGGLAAYDPSSPRQIYETVRNFVITVWDPSRSDIRQGINSLIYRALRDSTPADIERRRRDSPALAALHDRGYDPPLVLAELERLPEESFGRQFVRFIRGNGIDPLERLLAMDAPASFIEYSYRRSYKLHDMLHVVLGCDASILGEVRIVSFSLGQAADRGGRFAPAMAMLVLYLHLLIRRPWQIPRAIRLARQWEALGGCTPPYSGFPLEEWVMLPVAEVRRRVIGDARCD